MPQNSLSEKIPVDEIRKRLEAYASEIQKYLKDVNANVEGFKFTVEKKQNGVTIEVAMKASITGKS
jgi:hypothetical protein